MSSVEISFFRYVLEFIGVLSIACVCGVSLYWFINKNKDLLKWKNKE